MPMLFPNFGGSLGGGSGGDGGGGAVSPNHFLDMMLQLAFQEANGATSGADDSGNSFDWTGQGDANVQSGKLALDGSGDYATLASAAHDWNFIHGGARCSFHWPKIRRTGTSQRSTLLATNGASSGNFGLWIAQGDGGLQTAGTIRVFITRGVSGQPIIDYTTTFTIPDDGADHELLIEIDFGSDGTNALAFGLDGVRQEMADLARNNPSLGDASNDMFVGRANGVTSLDYDGNYSPVRISVHTLLADLFNNASYSIENDPANWPTSEAATGPFAFASRYSPMEETSAGGYVGSRYYRAEPQYLDLGSGSVLKVQMRGFQHLSTTTTLIESFKSTDHGQTFPYSSRVVVDSDGTHGVRNHAVSRDPTSGRICVFARTVNSSDVTQDVFYRLSTDDGATYGSRTSVASSLTSGTIPFGPAVKTASGWMQLFYKSDFCEALFSSDDLQTWGSRTTIYDFTGTTPGYNEPTPVAVTEDDIVIGARKDATGNHDYAFWKSTDGMATTPSFVGEAEWTATALDDACPLSMALVGSEVVTAWAERGGNQGVYYSRTATADFMTDPRRAVDGTETQVKIRTMRYLADSGDNGYPFVLPLSSSVFLVGWYESVRSGDDNLTRTWEMAEKAEAQILLSRLTATSADSVSVPHDTETVVEFPTEDIAGSFRSDTPPTHGFKVPAGVSAIVARWFTTLGPDSSAFEFRLIKNGATIAVVYGGQIGSGSSVYNVVETGRISCAEGDTFELAVWHNRGSAQSVNAVSGVGTLYFEVEDAG